MVFLIDTDQAVGLMPAPAPTALGDIFGWFTDAAPGSSDGTVLSNDWLNMVQAELQNVVLAAGLTPDQTKTLFNQMATAIPIIVGKQFSNDLAVNGYLNFPGPSNPIIQFGRNGTGTDGSRIVTFPEAFPNACLNVTLTVLGNTTYNGDTIQAQPPNAGNFTCYGGNPTTGAGQVTFFWFAIGY